MVADHLKSDDEWMQTARSRPLGTVHSPLCALVTEQLRNAILSGRYEAGDRLVEEHLARAFAVSRNPIREALRVLAVEGLVEIKPRVGAAVAAISHQDICEMVEIRATLEGLNARLAARRHDPAILARLQRMLDAGGQLGGRADCEDYARFNAEFHRIVAEAGGNRMLGRMIGTLRERIASMLGQVGGEADRMWAHHAEIVKAMLAGDEELADLLASRHAIHASRGLLERNRCEECVRGFPQGRRPLSCPHQACHRGTRGDRTPGGVKSVQSD